MNQIISVHSTLLNFDPTSFSSSLIFSPISMLQVTLKHITILTALWRTKANQLDPIVHTRASYPKDDKKEKENTIVVSARKTLNTTIPFANDIDSGERVRKEPNKPHVLTL